MSTPPEATTANRETVTICQAWEGDVYIVPGAEATRRYLVSSAVLRRASPVFQAMLSDRYAKGQDLSRQSPSEIILEDDEESILEAVLRMVHNDFDNSYDDFWESPNKIAQLCDKYDCIAFLTGYMGVWLRAQAMEPFSYGDEEELCERIVAARIFKEQEYAKIFLHRLAMHLDGHLKPLHEVADGLLDVSQIH
ncbi:Protein farnesyltransferase subunit beta [Elsinoe australis]|uniref:Protein farnesyltransferase subunit beta n=1 Tax=Elsinoe australis TaxID=40998 RepID=A0A2P8A0W1_9PEZI|nr:Protein farnesyltransferase subunit beta [Elsinoe australis]